jgi:hypothetical protein
MKAHKSAHFLTLGGAPKYINTTHTMKTLIITLCTVFSLGMVHAQQNAIEKYFANYLAMEDITKISVNGKVFQLASYIETDDKDLEEMNDFASTIESFQMILGDNGIFSKSEYSSALRKVENGYEELMSIQDKEGDFNFRIKEQNGIVEELLMVGYSENSLMILSLTGRMNLKQISKMGAKIQMEGFESLGKMTENGADRIKCYPNPVQSTSPVTIEVPENFIGGDASLVDMKGKTVMSYRMSTRKQELRLDRVNAGAYLLVFKKNDISITKKLEIQ